MDKDHKPCATCEAPTHKWETFPGGICLECHKAATANEDPAVAFAQMMGTFRGGAVAR